MKTLNKTLAMFAIGAVLPLSACSDDDADTNASGDATMSGTTGDSDSDSGTTGVDSDTGSTGDATTGEPAGTAEIRVVHGSPDAPAVDVYVAGSPDPVITGLAYGDASEYLEVPEGDYNFEVRAAGAPATDDPVYETGFLTLPADARVTALAAGFLASQEPGDMFRVMPLIEGFDAPAAGEAIVRIVHAGADAPTVAVDVGNDGSAEIESLDRFADTGMMGIPLPAATALQIGIWADGNRVTAFTTPELPESAELFVIATGALADLPRQDSGFSLLAIAPTGPVGFIKQNPVVNAMHVGSDAPAVDICAGGVPLLENVAFGDMGAVQVPPGAYTLDFYVAPSDACDGSPAISQDTPTLEAGERYLALATGELAPEGQDPAFKLAAFGDAFTLDSGPSAVLQVAHAAAAPAVDVGVVDGQTGQIAGADILVTDLAWPESSNEVGVPAGTYEIGIAAAGGTRPLSPVASFDVPVAEAGRAFVVAAGDLTAETGEEGFRLMVVDTVAWPWTVTEIQAN